MSFLREVSCNTLKYCSTCPQFPYWPVVLGKSVNINSCGISVLIADTDSHALDVDVDHSGAMVLS